MTPTERKIIDVLARYHEPLTYREVIQLGKFVCQPVTVTSCMTRLSQAGTIKAGEKRRCSVVGKRLLTYSL